MEESYAITLTMQRNQKDEKDQMFLFICNAHT